MVGKRREIQKGEAPCTLLLKRPRRGPTRTTRTTTRTTTTKEARVFLPARSCVFFSERKRERVTWSSRGGRTSKLTHVQAAGDDVASRRRGGDSSVNAPPPPRGGHRIDEEKGRRRRRRDRLRRPFSAGNWPSSPPRRARRSRWRLCVTCKARGRQSIMGRRRTRRRRRHHPFSPSRNERAATT